MVSNGWRTACIILIRQRWVCFHWHWLIEVWWHICISKVCSHWLRLVKISADYVECIHGTIPQLQVNWTVEKIFLYFTTICLLGSFKTVHVEPVSLHPNCIGTKWSHPGNTCLLENNIKILVTYEMKNYMSKHFVRRIRLNWYFKNFAVRHWFRNLAFLLLIIL